MKSLLCFWGSRAGDTKQGASAREKALGKPVGSLGVVQSPKGYIKALQTENACSSSEAMNVQTSWVSVANVSFSDMLKSVEQQSLPERRKAAQDLPAAPTSQVHFPRLHGRVSDVSEEDIVWSPRPLPPMAEDGPASIPHARKVCSQLPAMRGAVQTKSVVSTVAGSSAVQSRHDPLTAVSLPSRRSSCSRMAGMHGPAAKTALV